jgi:hypothetical protein
MPKHVTRLVELATSGNWIEEHPMHQLKKRPLFIYEMANNHMGDVEHGIRIVRELKKASEGYPSSIPGA